MKQPTAGELLRVLKHEELLDYIGTHKLPEDFEARKKLIFRIPERRKCQRYLKALRLGIDPGVFTRSKKKWRISSVVLLVEHCTCRTCKAGHDNVCDLMLKNTHPFYGIHITTFERDMDCLDYSDLPLEIYTRRLEVYVCKHCVHPAYLEGV